MRVMALIMLFVLSDLAVPLCREFKSEKWKQKLSSLIWIAYSPTKADPVKGVEATPAAISEDLAALRKVGFTGLVTYSSAGALGRELPSLARAQGFEGIIMGVWDPMSQEELAAAKAAAQNPILVGFCIGNEGLGQRYEFSVLSEAVRTLRRETGKPVTTTEIVEKYSDDNLLKLGDWVFPNAHPYFHGKLEPDAAVRWTVEAYDSLKKRTPRFIMFKEVGLPTDGDVRGVLSEEIQARYYKNLARTSVRFVYFEAFDQPWKTHLPVEPHWGIFRSNRTPKSLALNRIERKDNAPNSKVISAAAERTGARQNKAGAAFFVYQDAGSPNNHYKPTGYMGDAGDIQIDEAFKESPRSKGTSIRVVYKAEGKGPNKCTYTPPCKWAGVYWQEPPGNWGREENFKNGGFNLAPYTRLKFRARAEKNSVVEFKVGGIDQPYGDSLSSPRSHTFRLQQVWQEFEINLEGANLTRIIGGFCWVTSWDMNPGGTTFYLDDIRFEP